MLDCPKFLTTYLNLFFFAGMTINFPENDHSGMYLAGVYISPESI